MKNLIISGTVYKERSRQHNTHSEHLCRTVCWLTSDLSLKLNNVWSAISQSSTSPHKSSQYNLACKCVWYHTTFEAHFFLWSELTPLLSGDTGRNEGGGESLSMWRGGEGILGGGQLRGKMSGIGVGCSSRTASNYIQCVKPSITLWLACLSSCYSCKRCATLQEHIPPSDKVSARGCKSSALIKACF